jgi:hypothetical protein
MDACNKRHQSILKPKTPSLSHVICPSSSHDRYPNAVTVDDPRWIYNAFTTSVFTPRLDVATPPEKESGMRGGEMFKQLVQLPALKRRKRQVATREERLHQLLRTRQSQSR